MVKRNLVKNHCISKDSYGFISELNYSQTWARSFDGGGWADPPGVVEPWTLCAPEVRGRFDGGTRAAPGGGEEVPVGGEEVPVPEPWSTDTEEAESWSLKSERSFISRVRMSSLPTVLDWTSAPSGSVGCGWAWFWPGTVVAVGCWEWMDVAALLKACRSETGADGPPAAILPGCDPGTAGMDVWVDGGETVEDEVGMLVDGGCCEWAVSWEDCGDGLESLFTVWDGTGVGNGDTLPVEWGGEDADVTGTVAVGAAASGGDWVLLATSKDGAGADSLSVGAESRVLLLSNRACLSWLNACWRTPDGADSDRPKGAAEQSETLIPEIISWH